MLFVEKWYDAIESRHSTRTYNGRPVAGHILKQMEQVCRDFHPSDSVRAKLVVKPDSRVFRSSENDWLSRGRNYPFHLCSNFLEYKKQPAMTGCGNYYWPGICGNSCITASSCGMNVNSLSSNVGFTIKFW